MIGDFVVEGQIAAQMFRQGMAVDRGFGSDHHAVEFKEDTPAFEALRETKVAAITPHGLPFLPIPILPGEFGGAMGEDYSRELGIIK